MAAIIVLYVNIRYVPALVKNFFFQDDVVKAIQAAREDSNKGRPTEEVQDEAEGRVKGEGEGKFMRSGRLTRAILGMITG